MRKPVVRYSEFRFSRLREKRFSHLWLLLGWVGYLLLYFLTENLIPVEKCHVVHCALDDLIPFHEGFLLFYCFWYAYLVLSLLYFFLYDIPSFKKLQFYIIVTQAVAMAVYILWPSIQLLRPEVFPRDNLLTRFLGFIYTADTPTGVCPSLHVAYSMGILSVFWKYPGSSRLWKGILLVWILLICAAVCFVKQHSALDILAALPVCVLAELLLYWRSYWKPRLQGRAG